MGLRLYFLTLDLLPNFLGVCFLLPGNFLFCGDECVSLIPLPGTVGAVGSPLRIFLQYHFWIFLDQRAWVIRRVHACFWVTTVFSLFVVRTIGL